jgi:hypothetical protein|tara:strand:- start:560 stop:724 length:165 start_codon:yes stop_codon:yes gene_type:complete
MLDLPSTSRFFTGVVIGELPQGVKVRKNIGIFDHEPKRELWKVSLKGRYGLSHV